MNETDTAALEHVKSQFGNAETHGGILMWDGWKMKEAFDAGVKFQKAVDSGCEAGKLKSSYHSPRTDTDMAPRTALSFCCQQPVREVNAKLLCSQCHRVMQDCCEGLSRI